MATHPIKLLLDEHVWFDLADTLVQHGIDAVHVITVARKLSDETILTIASAEQRVVLTNNFSDFAHLASDWFVAGLEHAGIVFTLQLKPGELLRQCLRMASRVSSRDMRNSLRWLQEFA